MQCTELLVYQIHHQPHSKNTLLLFILLGGSHSLGALGLPGFHPWLHPQLPSHRSLLSSTGIQNT